MTYEHAQLDALGDGTRRALLARLLTDGPLPVGELARTVPVSRPAVSQHLRVLRQAGLVTDTKAGAKRVYRLDVQGFTAIQQYFDQFWTGALAAFQREVESRRVQEPER